MPLCAFNCILGLWRKWLVLSQKLFTLFKVYFIKSLFYLKPKFSCLLFSQMLSCFVLTPWNWTYCQDWFWVPLSIPQTPWTCESSQRWERNSLSGSLFCWHKYYFKLLVWPQHHRYRGDMAADMDREEMEEWRTIFNLFDVDGDESITCEVNWIELSLEKKERR